MDARSLEAARRAIGFMPEDEGLALFEVGAEAARLGPLLEIGSYCGKSAIYLGAAARRSGQVVFSIDHHRGSEEQQPGEEYFDARLFDRRAGRVNTLPAFRKAIEEAGLAGTVLPVVAESATLAACWRQPLGLVFIDGGHSTEAAHADYEGWARFVVEGGFLAIHDVFLDPNDGGRPPFEIYRRALDSGAFREHAVAGSLRVLTRSG